MAPDTGRAWRDQEARIRDRRPEQTHRERDKHTHAKMGKGAVSSTLVRKPQAEGALGSGSAVRADLPEGHSGASGGQSPSPQSSCLPFTPMIPEPGASRHSALWQTQLPMHGPGCPWDRRGMDVWPGKPSPAGATPTSGWPSSPCHPELRSSPLACGSSQARRILFREATAFLQSPLLLLIFLSENLFPTYQSPAQILPLYSAPCPPRSAVTTAASAHLSPWHSWALTAAPQVGTLPDCAQTPPTCPWSPTQGPDACPAHALPGAS